MEKRMIAIARFEALRVALLHQCVLSPAEIAVVDCSSASSAMAGYAATLDAALAGPRGEASDVGGYYAPVTPALHEGIAEHVSCSGNTLIRLALFEGGSETSLWRSINAPSLGHSRRDQLLSWIMSKEFVAFDGGKEWREIIPSQFHYEGMDSYFSE